MRKSIINIFLFEVTPLFFVAVVYYLIITTLNQGISCDEGYYLMSYQSNQLLGDFVSDFGRIVRFITPKAYETDIMTFRYLRLILTMIVLPLFAYSLNRWLKYKFNFRMRPVLFYALIMLSGAISYTFAAPTISYDSLQFLIYLLAFSFCFLALSSKRLLWSYLFKVIAGIASFVGVMNYLPSGVFLLCFILLMFLLENNKYKRLNSASFYILGFFAGGLLYHIFVFDMVKYSMTVWRVIIDVFTKESESGHDASGFINSFLSRSLLFLLYVPIIYVFQFLFKRVKLKNKWFVYTLTVLAMILMVILRKIYFLYAPVFYFFVAILVGGILAEHKIDKLFLKKHIALILLLLMFTFVPMLAVLGTNQNLFTKMLIFVPFWLIVFFVIYAYLKNIRLKSISVLLFSTLLFAGYVYLGNFSRYHYYYTPRSSKYTLSSAFRPQRVKFSEYQKHYYDDVFDILKQYGAKPKDSYLAFGENQMAVFLMDGYIAGKLPYHWFQYKDFPKEKPKFFILFKNEEQEVMDLLETTDWEFPNSYKRIELRAMSENMDQEKLKTIIYVPI